jgi:hypothetical protein
MLIRVSWLLLLSVMGAISTVHAQQEYALDVSGTSLMQEDMLSAFNQLMAGSR